MNILLDAGEKLTVCSPTNHCIEIICENDYFLQTRNPNSTEER